MAIAANERPAAVSDDQVCEIDCNWNPVFGWTIGMYLIIG